jgi:phosphoribosylcarboxyaminoimidazole (NCAIR) mutase
MPSIVDPNRGARGTSMSVKIPKIAVAARAPQTTQSPGKVDVSFGGKPEDITSAAGSLASAATGLAGGLVRAVPIFGNPVADFIGSATDAVSKIGIPGGPKIGDVASIPIKAAENVGNLALTALSLPGAAVERGIAEFSVRYRQAGTDGFAQLPGEVQNLIRQGKHSEAAAKLQESGKTYGDGFGGLALSLVLDPLNYIPLTWFTKPITVGAKGVRALTKVATTAEESMLKIASNRAQTVLRSSVDVKAWDELSQVAGGVKKVVNGKTINLGEEATLNINSTLAGLEKSAARNGFVADSMLSAGESAEDVFNTIVTSVDPRLAAAGEKVVPLKKARQIWDAIFPEEPGLFDEIVGQVRKGITEDEAFDTVTFIQRKIQERAVSAEVGQRTAVEVLKARAAHFVDDIDADAARIIRENKLELNNLVDDLPMAESQVREWVKYGLGLSDEAASPIVKAVMGKVTASGAKGRETALDALEWSRQQAFGKMRREIGEIRAAGAGRGAATTETVSRLTIASARSLTDDAIGAISKKISSSSGKNLQETLRTIVNQYDELYAKFGNTPASELDANRIMKFIEESAVKVDVIDAATLAKLPRSVQDLYRRAARIGYTLALAPEGGLKEIIDVVETASGREITTKLVTPFADLADDVFKPGIALRAEDGLKDTRNTFQRIVEGAFGERRSATIRQRAYERFLLSGANNKLSRYESRDLWVALHRAATELNVQVKGLAGLSTLTNQVDEIAKKALGDTGYRRLIEGAGTQRKPALRMLLKAYDGDLTTVGILPRLTAGLKTQAPWVMLFTDFIYPTLRFSAFNPFFRFVQENIEPKFFQYLRGIYGDTRDEILQANKSRIISRAFTGKRSVIREFGDMQQSIMRATMHTSAEVSKLNPEFITQFDKLTNNRIFKSLSDVGGRKRKAFEQIASREAAEKFVKDLEIRSPKTVENLVKFYGTDDPYEIAYNLAVDYSIRNNPVAAARYIDDAAAKHVAERMAKASPGEIQTYYEAVDAFKYAFDQGAKVANRSIYYAQEIPYIVRSFNHPFLGVYPLSYMTTKIIPEFSRALFTRIPFVPAKTPLIGGERLGAGFNAYREISESVQQELEYGDTGLIEFINSQPDLLYFINMLFPAIPSQIGFSVPAWIRKSAIEPGMQGEGVQWEDAMRRIRDQVSRGTVLGSSEVVIKAIEDVFGTSVPNPDDPKYNRFGQ